MFREGMHISTRRFLSQLAAILLLLLLGTGLIVVSDGARQAARPLYRDGIVLLAFHAGVQEAQQAAILSSAGAIEIKRIGAGVHVVAVGHGRVPEVIQSLKARKEVRYAEPDYLQSLAAGSLPNDTSAGSQWAVQNTGQSVNGTTGTAGADERSSAAWSVTTGTNSVVVAVLDSGVQYSHPDLVTNIWNNPGGINGCAAGTHGYNVLAASCDPMDDDTTYGGHGTHVAGILGAVGNNAAGVAGVNWTTSIMAVKWVNSSDVGNTSDLITGMDWVLHAKQAGVNVRVANDSATWAGTASSQALSDEIDLLGTNDILFVAASGNTAQNNDQVPRYPCSYNRPTMICVAASDQDDNLWSSSNFGTATVQLAAPGSNIYSTLRQSNYGYISGGSMAAPQVTGTAALILSLGNQPVNSLRAMILNNVDVLSSLSGVVGSGGRLNVCKAVPGCAGAVAAIPPNVALPVVTSIPQQGSLLGASTGAWSGLPTTYTYQWNRCSSSGLNCTPIPGAAGQTYALLATADVQSTLSVTVTASNSLGSTAAQSSTSSVVTTATSSFALTSSITNGSTISGTPQWRGTPASGKTVNFVQFYIDGAWNQTDSTSPYQFTTGGSATLDTTTLSNGSHVLGLRALSNDNRTYVFSGVTVTVSNAPKNTALPVVSGTATVGQTLTTSNGTWTSNPASFTYGWQHCDSGGLNCAVISGATNNSYLLSSADSGFTIRSSVKATNSVGSTTAVSAQTAVVTSPTSVSISTTSLPTGVLNSAYSATLAATGGVTPYTWSLASGTLPPGLGLASSTGNISGTPTATGTNNITVQVTDANSATATKALSLTVQTTVATTTAHIQTTGASTPGSGASSVNVTINPATAGNTLLVGINTDASSLTAVSDNKSDTFSVASKVVAGGETYAIYYAKNIAAGATSVTVTTSYGDSDVIVSEYQGLDPVAPFDQTSFFDNGYNGGLSYTSHAAPQTTSAFELLWGFSGDKYGNTLVWTPATGWTARRAQRSSFAQEQIVSTQGQFAATGTFTSSSGYEIGAMIATFKAASGAPPPPPPTISSFTAKPKAITSGQSSQLAWSVSGATSLSISGIGTVTGTSTSVSPAQTTTYTLTAANAGGSTTAQTAVTVTPDTTLPTVSITAPTAGSPVSGTVSISATASDDVGVASVQFQLGGSNLGSAITTAPYTFSWNTATVANGPYALTAIAKDLSNNPATSAPVSVTVNNPVPSIASFTANPSAITAGQSSTLSWSVSGATSLSISGVGTVTGTSIVVNPALTTTYTLTATNAAGPSTAQATVTVTPDTALPTVSITAPTAGATVSGTVSVTASASDNVGVASVQFQLGGSNLGSALTTAPYTLSWNTITLANGPFTLTAIAKDLANNPATSAPISVTVNNPPPVISSFTAGPATILSGGSSTLSWAVSNATSLSISGIGTVTGTSKSVSPTQTTSYTLTATNTSGSTTAQTTVTVSTATASITHAQSTGATTPSTGATSLSITINPTLAGSLLLVGISTDGSSITSVTDNKSDAFTAASNKVVGGSTFAIYYAKNIAAGATSVSVSFPYGGADVIVAEYQGLDPVAPLDKTSFLDNGYTGGSAYTSGSTPQTTSTLELLWGFAGDKYGATPVWTPSAGWTARRTQHSSFAQERIVSALGQFASSGTMNSSSGYEIGATIAAFAASGVASPPPPPTISSFTASPSSITSGQSSQLSWSVSNAASLSISGIGTVTGASTTVSPTQTTTYTLTATNSSGSTTAQTTVTVTGSGSGSGVRIILDSDLADDADDVGDHAMMWTLAKQGKLNVLALITSSTNVYSAPAAYAIAKYYGHTTVPIGAYQGNTPNSFSSTFSYYAQSIAAQFGKGSSDTRANYPDAVTVYRQALVSAPNASVYIVAGGFYEPLKALLQSGADSISPLTGTQLVAQKVAALVPVAGFFPDSGSSGTSNFTFDPDGASYVFANWPAPIISVGNEVGQNTLTGPASNADPNTNPVKAAYNLYCTNGQFCPNMTPGWTQVALLFVANGLGSNFVYGGQNGTTVVWGSSQATPGRSIWTQTPNHQDSYIEKTISDSSMSSILNALIQAGP